MVNTNTLIPSLKDYAAGLHDSVFALSRYLDKGSYWISEHRLKTDVDALIAQMGQLQQLTETPDLTEREQAALAALIVIQNALPAALEASLNRGVGSWSDLGDLRWTMARIADGAKEFYQATRRYQQVEAAMTSATARLFFGALDTMKKMVDKNHHLPILRNVHLAFAANELRASVTDLETSHTTVFPLREAVVVPFAITIDHATLHEVFQQVKDANNTVRFVYIEETQSLEVHDEQIVSAGRGLRFKTTLLGITADEYPLLPESARFTRPLATIWNSRLRDISAFADPADARFSFLRLSANNGLEILATDAYAFRALYPTPFDMTATLTEGQVLYLPARAFKNILIAFEDAAQIEVWSPDEAQPEILMFRSENLMAFLYVGTREDQQWAAGEWGFTAAMTLDKTTLKQAAKGANGKGTLWFDIDQRRLQQLRVQTDTLETTVPVSVDVEVLDSTHIGLIQTAAHFSLTGKSLKRFLASVPAGKGTVRVLMGVTERGQQVMGIEQENVLDVFISDHYLPPLGKRWNSHADALKLHQQYQQKLAALRALALDVSEILDRRVIDWPYYIDSLDTWEEQRAKVGAAGVPFEIARVLRNLYNSCQEIEHFCRLSACWNFFELAASSPPTAYPVPEHHAAFTNQAGQPLILREERELGWLDESYSWLEQWRKAHPSADGLDDGLWYFLLCQN